MIIKIFISVCCMVVFFDWFIFFRLPTLAFKIVDRIHARWVNRQSRFAIALYLQQDPIRLTPGSVVIEVAA